MNRKTALARICEKYGVCDMYAFGSRGKEALDFLHERIDCFTPSHSDIDIGVRFSKDVHPTLKSLVQIEFELEDFFKLSRVDVVSVTDAPPFLALEIISGELLFAHNPDDQARFELYVLARAGDLLFYERQRRKNLLSVKENDSR